MKKYLSILLIAILMLGIFTACKQGNGAEEVGGNISSPGATTTEAPAEDEGKEIDLGEISGAVYTNDFAGITFTPPEGWMFASKEELVQMMSTGAEIFDESKQSLIDYSMNSTVYDMMAYSADATESVIVMFENLARYPLGTLMTVEMYMDALETQFQDIPDLPYSIDARSDAKLGAQDYKCLSVSLAEIGLYQDLLVRREGKYIVCITLSGLEANPSAKLGEYFS